VQGRIGLRRPTVPVAKPACFPAGSVVALRANNHVAEPMSAFDFNAPRLHLDAPLAAGARVALDRGQANYLLNVLRLRDRDPVLIFNGRDGEWRAEIAVEGRKAAGLVCIELTRPQTDPLDLVYLFAPLKHARLDYMVQKAVEMGVGALQPVRTRRTQTTRVNLERMRANAIEAAEQCGILSVPAIREEQDLARAISALEPDRLLVFCDEDAPISNPVEALCALRERANRVVAGCPVRGREAETGALPGAWNNIAKIAVIVGPEGGVTDEERTLVAAHERCVRVSLGPRILRADTAAVAVLAVVQATLGDWCRSDGSTTSRAD
jgi:16S rRNA (uracil1498-N3)-methyltransferase